MNLERIQVYAWTDSQIVLHWLKKSSNLLKVYVANRVPNIQSISEEFEIKWNWIKGEDNPADLISRGTTILELAKKLKWWKGPEWLFDINKEWPTQPSFLQIERRKEEKVEEIEKEFKAIHLTIVSDIELMKGKWFKFNKNKQNLYPLIETYGDWKKLKNVTSAVFQAAYKFENLKNKKIGNIKTILKL